MKNTILGLMAATLLATPVLANDELVGLTASEQNQIAATQVSKPATGSWRTVLFTRMDSDANSLLSVIELEQTGCRVNKKLFAYANADRDAGLSKGEFFKNRELFKRCK
ncbi:hypothetical protein UFOVP447_228 [uncultured Caudovirales phage]|uniref:Uncharacterized protein n=1 Tax=uncultured Caudovirales phage TaxID=2100421 RepID=A0A6J5MF65_9CAUD|nr:hypothetical protein UFOVP447_228 [uncultured Caudovirales phage]